jgi:hypothetical protein
MPELFSDPTFIGVLIGAFFSLGGVVLSNWSDRKQQQNQFAYERSQRKIDRDLDLRKTIYLEAAEAISASINAVSSLANLDLTTTEIAGKYQAHSSVIYKLQIVADEPLLEAVNNFLSEVTVGLLSLSSKRLPLEALKNKIAIDQQAQSAAQQKANQAIEVMRHYNLENVLDQNRWDAVNRDFEFQQEQAVKAGDQWALAQNILVERQIELMRHCLAETRRISLITIAVLIHARNELGLPIDEARYRKIISAAQERQIEGLDQFLDEFRNLWVDLWADIEPAASPAG